MQDFRNLRVWQSAHDLSLAIYQVTKFFPDEERFGLVSQLRRAAVSIESNIAEGCGRDSDADFARFLRIAMGSSFEVETQILLALDLKFLKASDHESISNHLGQIKRMLNSLISKLKS